MRPSALGQPARGDRRRSPNPSGASPSRPAGYAPTVRLFAGTSGFSYAAWKGPFYPRDLGAEGMLAHYANRLPAVEVNNTFYRMPSRRTLAGWRAQVPAAFRFALKAPQRITHVQRLKDAAEPLFAFLDAAEELGETLGSILFQLPPSLRADLARLADFLALLPAGTRAAFEFRHRSWLADPVFEALRVRNLALCISEGEEVETPLVATADWGYLRLRREDYGGEDLRAWTERIEAQPWSEAFVFFKHEDAGVAPRRAEALLALGEARP